MIGYWRHRIGRALAISCLSIAAFGPSAGLAQQRPPAQNSSGPFQIEKFSGWTAAYTGQGRSKVCYALGEPKERLPKGLKRDPASLFVSTRVGDGAKNEIAIRLGFSSKPREDGTLTVGNANFALVTEGENAFLKNPAQEAQLLDALRKGQSFTVKVTSARGNALTDRYELRGFAQAVDRMARECP
jgi:invasion protein IalB